ncbi:hypothetical protein E4U53_006865 [Claviceps sorghi]|nr:hypothetical protein E4U53_006865 [Claviceps sorghi]
MHEAGSDHSKSPNPKTPRSQSKDSLPRQVRFEDRAKKHASSSRQPSPGNVNNAHSNDDDDDDDDNNNNNNKNTTQPDSHPQLGSGLPFLNRPPTWYTAADPTRSVNCQPVFPHTGPGAVPPHHHFSHPFVNQHHHHHFLLQQQQQQQQQSQQSQHFVPPGLSYIGPYQQQNNMGDYQNCVPPPTGVNFQPPVPDTTFGPIQHVYVPRFDGSFQVGVSSPFVSTAPAPAMAPAVGPVPVQNTYAVPQPSYIPVPASQPVMVNGQAYVPAVQGVPCQQPVMATATPVMAAAAVPGVPSVPIAGVQAGAPVPIIPGNATSSNVPDVSGLGKTPHEETLRQVEFAYNNRLFEPQEFKPADDDPSRFYYVREVDGNWTQRNRFTIDHMGDSRWYVTDEGWFYAVRLPD